MSEPEPTYEQWYEAYLHGDELTTIMFVKYLIAERTKLIEEHQEALKRLGEHT